MSLENVTWLVQSNLGSTSDTADLIQRACVEEGCQYHPLRVTPFSYSLPEDMPNIEPPFVFYGRTSLILGAYKDDYWKSGVFFNPHKFSPEQYFEHWGGKMLNSDCSLVALRDVDKLPYAPDERVFIRPNDDLKFFAGGVVTFEHLLSMKQNATDSVDEPINLSSTILVAAQKHICAEWRLFMIGTQFISGSQYLPKASSFVPQEVIDFACASASEWTPENVFVIDIAMLEDDNLRIIECNCFNGSGFYESNLNQIVRQVSLYAKLNFSH
jgi:hypothetical protein